jgi:hypothetical protein
VLGAGFALALFALGLGVSAPGCARACDPGDLFNDCGKGGVCDAETRTCEDRVSCTSAAECSDGYVCYSEGYCARNCYSGFFPFEYCAKGYTCDRTSYVCVPSAGN